MKALRLHSWNVTPKEAVQIQLRLRDLVETKDRLARIRRVAGADIALDLERGRAIAGVIVYRYPEMQEIERAWAHRPIRFPYVPGLLSFREIPTLTAAFAKLKTTPDVIFVDGHGWSHPRRIGIACHLGLVLGCPTVGCAKSILVGEADKLVEEKGACAYLRHKGEVIGVCLHLRAETRPIYVSTGNRVSLDTAVKLVLATSDGYRIPKPTREADRYVAERKLFLARSLWKLKRH